ncbi:MAG: hypothetical protein KA248_03965 [Kiritimatiellae bacterium]|nr:hypothetical protein [Kiritimatiellia bacterium]
MFKPSLLVAAGVLIAAGCRSPQVGEIRPMTDGELRAVFSRAQDPRRFWITVYGSEEGAVFANANRLHPEQVVALPFAGGKSRPDWPLVSVQSTTKESFLALVDTSSRDSWGAPDVVLGLRGAPLGPPAYEAAPEHVLEPVKGYACVIPTIRYDLMQMENVVVYLRAARGPLGYLARRDEKKTPPVLVFGMAWINVFSFVQLNYPEQLVFLSSTSAYGPSAEQLLAEVPLKTVRGALAVEGLVDGEPATLILDSAGDFELAMTEPPAEPVRVSVGDLVFPRAKAVASREHALGLPDYPRIGAKWLAKYKVTIAPKAKVVYFERP